MGFFQFPKKKKRGGSGGWLFVLAGFLAQTQTTKKKI
jgi:hypothetical protein